MLSQALLSSAYFAPIQWYQKLYRYDKVTVEAYDSFIKQTYRNRCIIATTAGVQALTVPVERGMDGSDADNAQPTKKCLMKDVRISDHGNWRHLHWNALQSAYGESPFFEFYADDVRPFFERRWKYLYDFNAEICAKMCELIGLSPCVKPSEEYIPADDGRLTGVADLRDAIRPKHPLPTHCSLRTAITRCTRPSTASCPTSAYSTCSSTWDPRACCTLTTKRQYTVHPQFVRMENKFY